MSNSELWHPMQDDRVPNFCIGAQRSATTYLYELLQAHTNAHLSPLKEVHYFDINASKPFDFYHSCFPALDHAVDITPSYSVTKERLTRLFFYNPQAKILLLTRNPSDRIVSHYLYYRDRFSDVGSFQAFLETNRDDCIGRCAYATISKEVMALFGPGSFMTMPTYELTHSPQNSIEKIASFYNLSLRDNLSSDSSRRLVNSSRGVRSSAVFRGLRSLYRSLPLTIPYPLKSTLVKSIDAVHRRMPHQDSKRDEQEIASMTMKAQEFLASINLEEYWDSK